MPIENGLEGPNGLIAVLAIQAKEGSQGSPVRPFTFIESYGLEDIEDQGRVSRVAGVEVQAGPENGKDSMRGQKGRGNDGPKARQRRRGIRELLDALLQTLLDRRVLVGIGENPGPDGIKAILNRLQVRLGRFPGQAHAFARLGHDGGYAAVGTETARLNAWSIHIPYHFREGASLPKQGTRHS